MAKKDPAAVKLGRKGGKAKFANMTPEEIKAYQRDVAVRGWDTRRARVTVKATGKAEGSK
jgi:hypothetical protein